MSSLRLHAHPYSNNSMRASIALEEKDLAYEYVHVDLFTKANRSPEYLAINPRGQVPCLVDGDAVVYESVAIVEYLEHRFPKPSLIPHDKKAMAACFRRIGEFHQKLDPKNVFGSVRFRGQRRDELGPRLGALVDECALWEQYLEAGDYFGVESFSIADIVVLPFFATVIDGLGLPDSRFPALHAWYARCRERPSVAAQRWFEAFAADKANAELKVLADV